MTAGDIATAQATAVVFAAGKRVGSAVLVDTRYLVTAAHLLERHGTSIGMKVPADQVEVEFPAQPGGGDPVLIPAHRVDLGTQSGGVDVAVLDLGERPPGVLPSPVRIWPAGRMPASVKVFGYPLAEHTLNGVWREFTVGGPTAAGSIQLDWSGDTGTFPGHSGGPVIDSDGHALAGILVEGSEQGLFDRFLPVTLIARVWPRLPRCWLMIGADQADARDHFTRRAYGRISQARGGDQFRGRRSALAAIHDWLCAEEPPGQVLVITGQPGAGKSAVLARAALALETEQADPGLAFHARGATVSHFLTAVADLTGIDPPATADELVDALTGPPQERPIRVVVDALDEAASAADRRQITRALNDLAILPGMRVAVATRTLAAENRYLSGQLLAGLGVTGPGSPSLVNLDSDTFFDPDDLRQFAAALLTQDGMDRPGPPNRAWKDYRANPMVRDRLAAMIAERAQRNFLIAALAAIPLSAKPNLIDPDAEGFNPADIPSRVGEALAKHLEALSEPSQKLERILLTALAYARGAGLDDPHWLAFAGALGYRDPTVADLDTLRRSPAADYLLQTTTAQTGAPVTRLFHQALTDELLAGRPQANEEGLLLRVLVEEASRIGWEPGYAREYAAEHASAAGRLDQLLCDVRYLLAADPDRLLVALPAAATPAGKETARVYRHAASSLRGRPAAVAAAYLQLHARKLGADQLAELVSQAGPDLPWSTHWIRWRRDSSRVLIRHLPDDPATRRRIFNWHVSGETSGGVGAVAIGQMDGDPIAVSSREDDTAVKVWDLRDGSWRATLRGHTESVKAVATGVVDGEAIAVSADSGGIIRVWNVSDGSQRAVLEGPNGYISAYAMAIGEVDGIPVVVVVGGNDSEFYEEWKQRGIDPGTYFQQRVAVRVWDLRSLSRTIEPGTDPDQVQPMPVLLDVGKQPWAVALGEVDGRPTVIAADNEMVRMWDLRTRTVRAKLPKPNVRSIAIGEADGHSVVALADGEDLLLWNFREEEPVELHGHTSGIAGVAIGQVDDCPVAVTASVDCMVRVWDLRAGTERATLEGHTEGANCVALGELDGRPIAATGGGDNTIRVWELDPTFDSAGLVGPTGKTLAVAVGSVDERPVIAAGGQYLTVWVWDLRNGDLRAQFEGDRNYTNWVYALAMGEVNGRSLVISGGDDPTVRVWDVGNGNEKTLEGHRTPWKVALAERRGRPIAICTGLDPRLRLWDLSTQSELSPLEGHTAQVTSIATGEINGRSCVVSVSGDRTLRVWDLDDSTQFLLEDCTEIVWAVAVGKVDGRPVIVTVEHEMAEDGMAEDGMAEDGIVRMWDPQTREIWVGRGHIGDVQAVAIGQVEDHPVIVSGGADGTIRVWDPHSHAVEVIDVEAPVNDLAITEDSALAVATDRGILALQLLGRPC